MAGHNSTRRSSTAFNLHDSGSEDDDGNNTANPNNKNNKQVAFEHCDYSAIMFPNTRNLTRIDNNLPITQPPSGSFSSALHFDRGIRPNPLTPSNRSSTPFSFQEARKDTGL